MLLAWLGLAAALHERALLTPRVRIERRGPRAAATEAEEPADASEPAGASVGIDLGTTSSAIAVVRDGRPEVVADAAGRKTMPSRVSFGPDGPRVGHEASSAYVGSAKRLIGRSHEEVVGTPRARAFFAQQLVELPDGSAGLRCPESDTLASPEEVAALVLGSLLAQAEAVCGVRATRAVIGVPAHFTKAQREATRRAASAVGLDKVRLLEEPVAAALAYGAAGDDTEELVGPCVNTAAFVEAALAASSLPGRRRWLLASSPYLW